MSTTTPSRSRRSYGPVVALLGGLLLVIAAVCGGAVHLISSSIAAMARMIDERTGPREHSDDDYRVRVRLPEGRGWELLSGELATSWDDEAIIVLRGEGCRGSVLVRTVASDVSHEDAIRAVYDGQTRTVAGPPLAGYSGATLDLVDTTDDTTFATSFLHGGVLYRLEEQDAHCRSTLVAAFELLPGEVRPRWVRAPIENAIGRSYRIRDRVFESAASGLVVDASEPLSPIVEGASRIRRGAELVVLHRNGARVSMDPFHRSPEQIAVAGPQPGDETVEVSLLGASHRFVREPREHYELFALLDVGGLSIWLTADGSSARTVREALETVGPRLGRLSPEALESLRLELAPQIHDRRSGAGWSLRDGTFRTHPETGPAIALHVPRWTEVMAGREREDQDEEAPELVGLARRELGVSATVTSEPTSAASAAMALEAYVSTLGLSNAERLATIEVDRVGRARAELVYELDPTTRNRFTIVVQVQDGTLFALEAWRRWPEHEGAARFVDDLVEGFVVEPRVDPPAEPDVHRDERAGFVLFAPGAQLDVAPVPDPELADVESVASACADSEQDSICVHVASDVSATDGLLAGLDWIEADRSVGAIWALPTTPTTLDDRPATARSFWDGGDEVRVVTTSIDRTVYLAVARGGPRTDWSALFARVDLDP